MQSKRVFALKSVTLKGEKNNFMVLKTEETEALTGKMTAHYFIISQTSAEQKTRSRILAAQCILCTHAVALQQK